MDKLYGVIIAHSIYSAVNQETDRIVPHCVQDKLFDITLVNSLELILMELKLTIKTTISNFV